jgi:hypothetical protein
MTSSPQDALSLSAQDASILSAIACDPSIKENDQAVYYRLIGRLESSYAEEVARALTGETDVTQKASEAASAMRDWVSEKQDQVRRNREQPVAGRRQRRHRTTRSPRSRPGNTSGD